MKISVFWLKLLLKFVSKAPMNHKPELGQNGLAQAHYKPLSKTMMALFNSLRLRQNGHYNADDIFKCIFLNENVWIPTIISLKFVPKVRN